ncbi:hypothetical protein ACJ72_08018 [Emergomyces africanus]|uniref:Aminoglycoside phosphotransferase domain-containing protein n=1 Tax=Emergomyces africanus TaxID=1955775 RepID=A0A1B7NM61_9EURO|nr:hypothetical protein ACJ72_08018 [Emergomyces africanus]
MKSQKPNENPLLDPLFNYTSGRWLWDEATHLRKRHQPFNVDGLKTVASKSVNARCCTSITKLSEGSYNKVFLLMMDNGVQAIARIPNPYLPPRVSTASEVATLDFLRTELDIPVPRVLAWSNNKDQSVEAEYIIMEMAPGEELGKSWMSMDISERVNIVSQLANIQARACSIDFKSYGSLYYRGDIDGCLDIPGISDRFCIGPSAAMSFWEAEREAMDKYRGPWTSPESYAKDVARREIEWIRRFAKPRDHADPLRQSTSQESPDSHIQLLDKYLKIIPLVLPSNVGLYRPTIWHPDLHSGNIFIKNQKIVSIIDWQGCMSLPLFMNCKLPKFLRINGPLLFDLPPATGLTAEEKKETLLRYEHTQLQRFYISKFKNLDPHIFQAISYPHAIIRQQLIDFAGSTWEDDGLFFLRDMMHNVWRNWDEMTSKPNEKCPITFGPKEISSHIAEGEIWNNYKVFFDSLDIPLGGWVHPEDFKSKADVMRNLARELLDSADDRDEARQALKAWKLSDPNSTSLCSKVMDI